MRIEVEDKNNAAVVSLQGDLDFNSYAGFHDRMLALIDNKVAKIVVNLGAVGHIDSMGLGTLTKLWKIGELGGVSVVLAAVPPNVGKLIKLINLDNRMKVFDTTDSALA